MGMDSKAHMAVMVHMAAVMAHMAPMVSQVCLVASMASSKENIRASRA